MIIDFFKIHEKKIIFFLLLIFFIIKILLIFPTFSDENIYFNMAKNILENKLVPYSDFFYAHPPLQIYSISLFFMFLGISLFSGKLFPIIFSLSSAYLVYEISKHIVKKDSKIPLISIFFFLITPQFLSFSSIGYGMWPAIFFGLLSLLLTFKEKPYLSGFFLVIGFFYRYLMIFYFPILMYYSIKRGQHKKFFISFLVFISVFCIMFYLSYGNNFLIQTVNYHVFSKTNNFVNPIILEYLALNSPLIFVTLLFFYYNKKEIEIIAIPLLLDIFIFLFFKQNFYHYFLLSLPFYIIIFSRFFIETEYKFGLILLFLFMIFAGRNTIIFHNSPNQVMISTETLIASYLDERSVFGDPILSNYISFKLNLSIPHNNFDGDINRIMYEQGLLEEIKSSNPDFFIESSQYNGNNFGEFLKKYSKISNFDGFPNVTIYVLNSS